MSLGYNRASACGNVRANVTCEQLCQSQEGTIVLVLLGNICASVTWKQLHQFHSGTSVPVSLRNDRDTPTDEIFQINSSFHAKQ